MVDIKQNILTTYAILIKKHGHRSVSMDDVAHKLGISKKTLYQHFPSKEELLAECVEFLIRNFMMTVQKIKAQDGHPILKLLRIYLSLSEELYAMNHVYVYHINRHYTKVLKIIDEFRNNLILENVRPLFLEARNEGCLHQELDIDLFINIRFRYFDQQYLTLKTNISNISFEDCFNHLVTYQLSGVCTPVFQEKFNELTEAIALPQTIIVKR